MNHTEEKSVSLEERMDRLEQLIEKMESDHISLDESFTLYLLRGILYSPIITFFNKR